MEMGKPIAEAEAQASYVAYQPLGVVLAIMPWNFPFWQVLRSAAPALMAGNGALLRHSPNVPQCALALEELVTTAGAPSGLFRTLLAGDASGGEAAEQAARVSNAGQSCITARRRRPSTWPTTHPTGWEPVPGLAAATAANWQQSAFTTSPTSGRSWGAGGRHGSAGDPHRVTIWSVP